MSAAAYALHADRPAAGRAAAPAAAAGAYPLPLDVRVAAGSGPTGASPADREARELAELRGLLAALAAPDTLELRPPARAAAPTTRREPDAPAAAGGRGAAGRDRGGHGPHRPHRTGGWAPVRPTDPPRVRLTGTPAEVEALAELLRTAYDLQPDGLLGDTVDGDGRWVVHLEVRPRLNRRQVFQMSGAAAGVPASPRGGAAEAPGLLSRPGLGDGGAAGPAGTTPAPAWAGAGRAPSAPPSALRAGHAP